MRESEYPDEFMAETRSTASILQLYALRDFFMAGSTKSVRTYQLVHMHVIRNQSGSTLLPAATLAPLPLVCSATFTRLTLTRASFLIQHE